MARHNFPGGYMDLAPGATGSANIQQMQPGGGYQTIFDQTFPATGAPAQPQYNVHPSVGGTNPGTTLQAGNPWIGKPRKELIAAQIGATPDVLAQLREALKIDLEGGAPAPAPVQAQPRQYPQEMAPQHPFVRLMELLQPYYSGQGFGGDVNELQDILTQVLGDLR